MLDLSPEKLLVLAVIVVIVLGPDRLPDAARRMGRFVATLRRMSGGIQDEVRQALSEPADDFHDALAPWRPQDIRRSVNDAVRSVNETVHSAVAPLSPVSPVSPVSSAPPVPSFAAPHPVSPAPRPGTRDAGLDEATAGLGEVATGLAEAAAAVPDDPSLN